MFDDIIIYSNYNKSEKIERRPDLYCNSKPEKFITKAGVRKKYNTYRNYKLI